MYHEKCRIKSKETLYEEIVEFLFVQNVNGQSKQIDVLHLVYCYFHCLKLN